MAGRNLSEEMDDEVVNMLLAEVEKAYPMYQRFLRAKAKMLGLGHPELVSGSSKNSQNKTEDSEINSG
jgi:oligoendopeptidase F